MSFSFLPTTGSAAPVVPVSAVAEWSEFVDNIDSNDLDTGEVVARSPAVAESNSRPILERSNYDGTTLRMRLIYADEGVAYGSAAPLTIRVFGTTGTNYWTVLRNLNGDASVPFPVDPPYSGHPGSDTRATSPGSAAESFLVTQPDNNAHSWDCDGYSKIIIAVEQPFATAGSGAALAYLEAKVV